MPDARPDDRSVENENQKPDHDGAPPRPATEPHKGSSNSGDTLTDPATGEPNRP